MVQSTSPQYMKDNSMSMPPMKLISKCVILAAGLVTAIWLFVSVSSPFAHLNVDKLSSWSQTLTHKPDALPDLAELPDGFVVAPPQISQRPARPDLASPSSQDFEEVPIVTKLPTDDGSWMSEAAIQAYLDSIWDLNDATYWRTECDSQFGLSPRYAQLKTFADEHTSSQIKYFFALDLYQVTELLPRLMGTLAQVVKMLGPTKCAISVVEGRSEDGTYAILSALQAKFEEIGTKYYLTRSDVNPHGAGVDRIEALASLRNLAMAPLMHNPDSRLYNADTLAIFMNDIAVCTEDVYELMFQHYDQKADMVCAMDWTIGGNQFYDTWVSRSMSGDLFFEIPQDVSFAFANNLFWDHPKSKDAYERKQPFQVYSCWGGMVTLPARPFLSGTLRFHKSDPADECYGSEPFNLAWDLWSQGYGRIATIPSINVGYNNYETQRIKRKKGYVHESVDLEAVNGKNEDKMTHKIEWRDKPPGQIKCIPDWGTVFWIDPPPVPNRSRRPT